jgi:hypothetical protein
MPVNDQNVCHHKPFGDTHDHDGPVTPCSMIGSHSVAYKILALLTFRSASTSFYVTIINDCKEKLVGRAGLEPATPCVSWVLSPVR